MNSHDPLDQCRQRPPTATWPRGWSRSRIAQLFVALAVLALSLAILRVVPAPAHSASAFRDSTPATSTPGVNIGESARSHVASTDLPTVSEDQTPSPRGQLGQGRPHVTTGLE